jgi:hypothetical protein
MLVTAEDVAVRVPLTALSPTAVAITFAVASLPAKAGTES